MSPIHGKIKSQHLHQDGRLLSQGERALVARIEGRIQAFQESARGTLKTYALVSSEIEQLNNLAVIAEQPNVPAEQAFFHLLDDPKEYQTHVIRALEKLKGILQGKSSRDFVQEVIDKVRAAPLQDDTAELQEVYLNEFNKILEAHEEDIVDQQLIAWVNTELEERTQLQARYGVLLQKVWDEVEKYQLDNQVVLDLDDKLNLVKISKKTEGLSFSVLYVQNKNQQREPYVLYRGKGQVLGQGEFGTVKLCQHLETGEWQAVKVLKAYASADSKIENDVLSALDRHHGEAVRGVGARGKYYVVQTLLPGIELENCLTREESAKLSLESRLEIARQAVQLLTTFHEQFLHRDIKPGNFLWDEETQTLSLCDFGFACHIGEDAKEALGSQGYIAPEVLAAPPGGLVPYSKKSDIYALGKTFERLFEGMGEVPEGIRTLVAEMTTENPHHRLGDMEAMCERIEQAQRVLLANKPSV